MISNSFSMTFLSLTIALCGCGGTSTTDEMAERWYRYGQHIGTAIGRQESSDEELGWDVGILMLSDSSPENTLLMASALMSSEQAVVSFKKRLHEGLRNPKDTSSELLRDSLPEAEQEESSAFVRLYGGKNFAAPEAKKVISTKLQSKSFAVRTLYARYLIYRYVAGHEDKRTVLADLDRQLSLEQPEREKKFWSLLKDLVDQHDPANSKPSASNRELCRENMLMMANAQMPYRVENRTESFTADLSKLVKFMSKETLPVCPEGGTYSIILVPKDSFTVHCTVKAHDEGVVGEPAGYSPGLNSG